MKTVLRFSILMAILSIAVFSCKDENEKEKENGVTLVSIAVTTQPVKKEYFVSETFETDGMVVTATYSDKTTEPVTVTADMLDYDFSTAGVNKTVTITYEGKKATVSGITVNDAPQAAYFGTWRSVWKNGGDDNFWTQINISASKIVYIDKNGYHFTISEVTWTEKANPGGGYTTGYPTGYSVTGKMASNNGYNVPKANGSGNAAVGDIALLSFYIYTDKESIRMGTWETAEQEAYYGPYNKKTDVQYWNVAWELNGGSWPTNPNHVTQVAKDGKIAAPAAPTKTGFAFGGWYADAALTDNRITFPYAATSNITLYAKWDNLAMLRITISGPGTYAGLYVSRWTEAGTWVNTYSIPTTLGTHTINNIVPGYYYRIVGTYMTCLDWTCISSVGSSYFLLSSGQTMNVIITGGAVGFPQ